MKVLQFPLTRITIWFVFGILFSFYTFPNPNFIFISIGISFLLLVLNYFLSKNDFIQKIYFGIFTYLMFFNIGIFTQIINTDSNQADNYVHQIKNETDEHFVQLVIREKLKSSLLNDRYIGVVKRINNQKSYGKILVNFHKIKGNSKLHIGSNFLIKGKVFKHKKPINPDQFDYGKYLTNKSVLAQMYADSYVIKISKTTDKDIWYYSDFLRTKILSNLEKSNFSKDELHVVAALILGQQQDVSPEILNDYQFAGAIHILSVSGLHVGFILLFITFLLKPLRKNKVGNTIRLVTIIVSLWGFAILAGLSPSVVRSVTMFSFVAFGMHIKRNTNIFHTLLVSILLILLFKPSFLFDVGFQLSYIALFFIFWLQPLLENLWTPNNKILNYFWKILTVSFAAQIGAFPLSIYYFHQFPGLFFLTNLIIIPFLSVIMALGVFVMVLAAFDYVPEISAKILEYSIYFLNKIINWVATFEQFIIKDIPFNWQILLSLYLLIVAVIIWFKNPTFHKLVFALIALLLFQTTFIVTRWDNKNQAEWIVFNLKNNTLITERTGEKVVAFCNDSIRKEIATNPTLKSYLIANFSSISSQKKIQNVFYFKDKKILILDSLGIYAKKINPDIIVITQSPKLNLARLLQTYKPEMIVADASNFKTYIKVWEATCTKEKIPFHATGEKGFYRVK
ncbi:MAG: ComEC family competence protein [Flavobacteriaceae bacterium]|nr:ComEC family competence protein [Flavobacteriaceae bacterium]